MLDTNKFIKEVSGQKVIIGIRANTHEELVALYNYFFNSGATSGELTELDETSGYFICPLNKLKRALTFRFESELEDGSDLDIYKLPAKQRQSYLEANREKLNNLKKAIKKQAQEFANFWLDSIPNKRQSFRQSTPEFATYNLAL